MSVASSPTAGTHAADADRSPKVQRCLAGVIASIYTSRGPLVHKSTSVSALVPGGLPDAFGLRVIHRETLANARSHPESRLERLKNRLSPYAPGHGVEEDILGFVSGHVDVELIDIHDTATALTQSEQRLLLRLYARTRQTSAGQAGAPESKPVSTKHAASRDPRVVSACHELSVQLEVVAKHTVFGEPVRFAASALKIGASESARLLAQAAQTPDQRLDGQLRSSAASLRRLAPTVKARPGGLLPAKAHYHAFAEAVGSVELACRAAVGK